MSEVAFKKHRILEDSIKTRPIFDDSEFEKNLIDIRKWY